MLKDFFPKKKQIEVSEERKKLLLATKKLNESLEGQLVLKEIVKFCKVDSIPEPEFGILAERNGMRKVAKFINDLVEASKVEPK